MVTGDLGAFGKEKFTWLTLQGSWPDVTRDCLNHIDKSGTTSQIWQPKHLLDSNRVSTFQETPHGQGLPKRESEDKGGSCPTLHSFQSTSPHPLCGLALLLSFTSLLAPQVKGKQKGGCRKGRAGHSLYELGWLVGL